MGVNILASGQAIGTNLTMQQLAATQYLGQQGVQMQLLGNQFVPGGLLSGGDAAKLNSQNRLSTSTNQPIMCSGIVTSSLGHQALPGGTPIATPQSTPVGTPRGPRDTGGDSSDTLSETDSQKSLRMRRKLPSIPPDQEAAPLPTSKKRDRNKSGKTPQERFRSYSPLRQYTPEGGYQIGLSNLMLQRPSASETNLRKIALGVESVPRPGSALGLLQGSSVVSSTGMRIPTNEYSSSREFDRGNPPLADLVSCLPPDLRHLLSSYKSQDSTSYGKQVPLVRSFKDHFQDEIKLTASDRRLLNRVSSLDREDRLLMDRSKEVLRNTKNRLEMQRKMVYSGLGRSRKLRAHRRQLSDPKIHMDIHPIKEDGGSENEYGRGYLGFLHPSLRPPYKSYEYESIDDSGKRSDWDPSQSYLASSYAVAGGALRETAINSVLDNGHHFTPDQGRYEMRRYSDGLDVRRRHDTQKLRKPRSWQPSPYGSDEDDDQLSREEKKAKIKAEIARRRQQIEENARLHEELLRLARLRESAELGFTPGGRSGEGYAISSVLKSIDDLLLSGRSRGDELSGYDSRGRLTRRTPEDRSMDRIASTFRTDDYTCGVYERLTDFSPLTDYSTPHAMPLLPDMPTRSRKLLEDLGSSPITESVLSLPQKAQALL